MVNVSEHGADCQVRDPRDAAQRRRDQRAPLSNGTAVAGLKGGTPHLLYPTSKGAVVNMTRAMAAHHAKDGIRVNCVLPRGE